MSIKLNEKQEYAFKLMRSGENIFLTGPGGTGKSLLIKTFKNMFDHTKIIGLTSLTGVSAVLIGGTTVHSYTGVGICKESKEQLLLKVSKKAYYRKRWKSLDVLIIDEISMMSPEMFDKLEYIARHIRNNDSPFGGIQLILSGDYCQLPVVKSDSFCFEAESWEKCVNNVVYLTTVVRQDDLHFQSILNDIRIGNITDDVKKVLNSRVGVKLQNKDGIKPTRLFATNDNVDSINQNELYRLGTDEREYFEYEMKVKTDGFVPDFVIDKAKKDCIASEKLEICVDAQVMLLYNLDIESGLVNGSRGIVTRFENDLPVVKFLNGSELLINFYTWEIMDGDEKKLEIVQIPLKLGFAFTIHKAQGVTLDFVEINLKNIFEFGQAYVALSRVRNIEGLSITSINFLKIKANPKAINYYEKL